MADADRWREMAEDALRAAASMREPEAARVLWQIALGYRALAQRAERPPPEGPGPIPGVAYGPDALRAITEAFDAAWSVIEPTTVGRTTEQIDEARLELAGAVLSVADEDSRDAAVLRDAALQALAIGYRRRR
jgi:hypothetical protein